jgi:hypothetical protein
MLAESCHREEGFENGRVLTDSCHKGGREFEYVQMSAESAEANIGGLAYVQIMYTPAL